jgi:cellulose synthase/poly-beta-1,6-N-acetylglucosamine synthase-like glycosyltransferase
LRTARSGVDVRRLLFWSSAAFLLHAYVAFPVLVLSRGRFLRRPFAAGDITPTVSVIIAVHNEAAVIRGRLENLLTLDYPEDRLEVLVASDGSDDGTTEILEECRSERVRWLDLPRVGKAEALNAAVAAARGDVLVFSDANSVFREDAVRKLVRPLADPSVGGVAGNQVYVGAEGGASDSSEIGEREYWNLDRALKVAQSAAGSVSGATGAIYAVRRRLVEPLRSDVNDDLLNSLRVIASGYRLVFEPEAVAYEAVPADASANFSRRVRVIVRGLRCVLVMRKLLDPRRYGFFSLQLLTHKVLSRTAVVPLLTLAATSSLLWKRGRLYRVATTGQALLYALGASGIVLSKRRVARTKLLALPAYFCLINAASAKALWDLVRGETHERWKPGRSTEPIAPTRPD